MQIIQHPCCGVLFWGNSLCYAYVFVVTDIYLPAMPQMQSDFAWQNTELTITGFLIGFAIGQLFGAQSAIGIRCKLPMTIGLILFIAGSVGCALSVTITQIVLFRVFQAFGACVGPMLSRAMVRDVLDKSRAAEMLSTLMILMAIAPIIAPLMGGQMLKYYSWDSLFWLLAIIGVLMLLASMLLPEPLE
ncbi:MAG: MFS transporter [Saprospiraceae bacterium]